MEMQQVRYFLALSRELNFTRAAEACNVTQPALTRAIQALEAEFGGRLFHRERGQTTLSELGRMMLPYFETIQMQAEAARAQAKAVSAMQGIELKFCAMCTLSPTILARFVVSFQGENDGVRLHVTDGGAQYMMERLSDGKLEIGILGYPAEIDERFHVLPLYSERFVVVLPPDHRLVAKDRVRVADLHNEPYIYRSKCEVFDFVEQEFIRQKVDCPIVFRSERDDWVLGMIRSGMGWGMFPEFNTFPEDVAVRPLVEPEFRRTVSLVTVRGRPYSPAVGAFVRAARCFPWPGERPDTLRPAA